MADKNTNQSLLPSGAGVDPISMFYRGLFGMGKTAVGALGSAANTIGGALTSPQSQNAAEVAWNNSPTSLFGLIPFSTVSGAVKSAYSYLTNPSTTQKGVLGNLSSKSTTPQPTTTDGGKTGTDVGTTGGGSGGGGGGGITGNDTISALIGALAQPDISPYESAKTTAASEVPLIQKRYQSLLDEIKANTEAGVSGYQTGEKEQLGMTQARAAASGTFSGSTELGQESNIREQTAANIATLENTASTQEEKANAQESLDELAVAKEIASLGISEGQAEQSGLKDALSAILELQKNQISLTAANQTTQTVATTTPSGLFGLLGIGGGTTTTTKTANAGSWAD